MSINGHIDDTFFDKKNCDRCGAKLFSSIMSWWTSEIICSDCYAGEQELRVKLRAKYGTDFEGNGTIPKYDETN